MKFRKFPFVLSLSKHERMPFDRLRASGTSPSQSFTSCHWRKHPGCFRNACSTFSQHRLSCHHDRTRVFSSLFTTKHTKDTKTSRHSSALSEKYRHIFEICLFNRRLDPPLAPPRRGVRRLPMHEFPSWEGQGVGFHIKLHIAFLCVSCVSWWQLNSYVFSIICLDIFR